jgi:signal transduction histidine kinase/outer membrane murein-binding lipoprotein Lpp
MSMPPAIPPARTITARLTSRYVLALGVIALLGIMGQVIVQATINQISSNAHIIDTATLQRSLSAHLSKDALAIQTAPDDAARAPYIADLRLIVPQWEHTHVALQQGDASLMLPGNNSPAITALFGQVALSFEEMLDSATHLLAVIDSRPPVTLPGTPPLSDLLASDVVRILSAEPAFDKGMQDIIVQYGRESDNRIANLQTVERTLLVIEFGVLALLGIVVFRPATRYVSRSIDDLVRAREREHELAALKDQFIVDANHELRTPIMALYNNLELLSALSERGTPEQRQRILKRAMAAGDNVLRLLTRVLDTSALEGRAPQLEFKAVPLAPLVRSVLETFDPREIGEPNLEALEQRARAVTVQVPQDLVVRADEGRLRQVLVNLVGNALKYSEPGTPLEITGVRRTSQHPEWRRPWNVTQEAMSRQVRVSVRDHGLGVPPRDISKLFNRFVRLERDIAGSVRGTGVGLYMCRVLIEAMGGRIWVESTGVPGEGSTFSFEVLEAPAAEAAAAVSMQRGGQSAPLGAL